MIRKYASAEILGIKGSTTRNRFAKLDKFADFDDYRTEDGYLYARIRAISSRVNKNHDGWPSVELAGAQDIFERHQSSEGGFTVEASKGAEYGFSTFLGKPIFVDHNNSNPERARGVIVDAKLHVEDHRTASELDPYYASAPDEHMPPTWVELLLEVDAKSFPKLAKAIIEGAKDSHKGIDGFSMGCDVEKSVCNICKNAASAPDEYCKHVKLKGAEFDWVNPKTGRKESKKSYEDCYGIHFFEISAVFDPADETALIREVRHEGEPMAKAASTHIAEHPLPQSDMMTAPEYVDTLREEEVCPVCGSDMDEGHQCEVCGYVAPPEGLDNPDLDKAQNTNQLQDPQDLGNPGQNVDIDVHPSTPDAAQASPSGSPGPSNMPIAASVTNEMSWQIYHPRLAGRINPVERPIQTTPQPATNEPNETIVSDQTAPVTNRTAASMIAAVNQGEHMSDRKTAADAPTADTSADKRVDVTGVGGVLEGNNEQASQADTQTDVEGKGGVIQDSNEEASSPDHTESLPTASGDDAGFNKDKTTDGSGPTKTFGDSNQPGSAVTQQAFPTSHQHAAGDDKVYPDNDGGLADGGASQGTEPADPVGKADERVDVKEHITSPANNSGPTTTWNGTDGNGVTKMQPPVTREVATPWTSSVVDLLKIADAEVELGITDPEDKYDRIAELEKETPEAIKATAKVLARVKTAGLKKNASVKREGIGRVPSFSRSASKEVVTTDRDEALFM